MQEKARQCNNFYDKLLKSGDKLLVHNMEVTLCGDLATYKSYFSLGPYRWGF